MEKWIYKIKSAKFTKIFIFKAFLCIFLLIFYIFVFFNQYDLIFFVNGFYSVSDCQMQIYMLDVGQATSFCVVTPDKNVWVLDTGSEKASNEFLLEIDIILRKNNLNHIDHLLLSHSDEDHVGGAAALLKQRQVNQIYRPKIYSKSEPKTQGWGTTEETEVYDEAIKYVYKEPNCVVSAIEDEKLTFEDFYIQIFATENTTRKDSNSYCPFVLFSYAGRNFLFTGDATQTRENEFLRDLGETNLTVDFLQVAHHGSNSSSSQKFLEKIKPKVALVSAKEKDYPHKDVLARLNSVGVEKIYVSYDTGLLGLGISNKIFVATSKNGLDIPLFVVTISLFAFVFLGADFSKFRQKYDDLFLRRKNFYKNFVKQ